MLLNFYFLNIIIKIENQIEKKQININKDLIEKKYNI